MPRGDHAAYPSSVCGVGSVPDGSFRLELTEIALS